VGFLLAAAGLAGCAGPPPAPPPVVAAPPAAPAAPSSSAARDEASELFYRGKTHALAGEAECAREAFHDALETFRTRSRPGDPEDQAFAGQLWDSIRLYGALVEPNGENAGERPPVEDTKDSLIAPQPAPSPEEVETAKREVAGTAARNTFDIPVVINEAVLRAVAFYQFRTPQAFAGALKRSGRYAPLMRGLLKEQGLPQDLFYVAMIESAFKHQAHSRAAAHGYWQFISGTGKRYGLKKTKFVDERSDPVKSTLAAAQYFKDLYEMFGDWHLAMAAYDAGEGKILKCLQRTGARDFWELAAGSCLRRETRDYVPYVLAAALISKDPARYGFDVMPDPPLSFDTVSVPRPVDLGRLAQVVGTPLEDLRLLNGELKTRSTPQGAGSYLLRVPAGTAVALQGRLTSLPPAAQVTEKRIVVKKGENMKKVAARSGVSVAELADWNDLPQSARLKRGMVLTVPVHQKAGGGKPKARPAGDPSLAGAQPRPQGEIRALPTPESAVTTASDVGPYTAAAGLTPTPRPAPDRVEIPAEGFQSEPPARSASSTGRKPGAAPAARRIRYTVQRGDTLYRIATKFGLSVEEIRRENSIGPPASIRAGQRLTLTLAIAQ
jgi:membrane-bound lytic murein transglycosylase D